MSSASTFVRYVAIDVVLLAFKGVNIARCQDSADCPCVSESSSQGIIIQSLMDSFGFPPGYGLRGCQAYDLNLPLTGCARNESHWCEFSWCYVDVVFCRVYPQNCSGAGGLVGSVGIPVCRARTFQTTSRHPQTLLKTEPAWSYTTCGYIDVFTMGIEEIIAGKNLIVAFDDYPTYITKPGLKTAVLPRKKELQGWSGAPVDFFNYITFYYNPRPNFTIVELKGMSKSDMFTKSDYDACINKAAVGEVDICISTFWITTPRQMVGHFTPSLYDDKFYLVLVREPLQLGLDFLLLMPFAPFQAAVWVYIALVVALFASVMVIVDYDSSEDFPYEGPVYFALPLRIAQGLFLSVTGFLAPEANHFACRTASAKFASLGYNIFCLIVLSSYTANLAAILVNSERKYTINNIQEFERKGLTLCMDVQVRPIFLHMFPGAEIHVSDSTSHVPRDVHSGKCDGGLMYEASILRMYSGYTVERDCGKVLSDPITYSAKDYACPDPSNPVLERDCVLDKVGDVVLSIPVAFPVRPDISHSFSWGVARGLEEGLWKLAGRENEEMVRPTKCVFADQSQLPLMGMPAESLYGTLLISACFIFIGLVVLAVKNSCGVVVINLAKSRGVTLPTLFREVEPIWVSDLHASAEALHDAMLVVQFEEDCTRSEDSLLTEEQPRSILL